VVEDRAVAEGLAAAVDAAVADLASGGNRAGSCAHLNWCSGRANGSVVELTTVAEASLCGVKCSF